MKTMKTVLYFIILALVAAIFTVGIRAFRTVSTDDVAKRAEVGLVLTDSRDRWERSVYDGILESARQQGLEITTIRCGRSLAEQVEAVRKLMVDGAATVIFSPLTDGGWGDTLLQAKELGVELLTINENIAERNKETGRIRHIGYDYQKIGNYLGTNFLSRTEGQKGHYVSLLGAVTSYSSNQIAKGFQESLLDGKSSLSTFGVSGDYDRTQAHMVVNGLLESDYTFQTLISYGDSMTLGAIDALHENGLIPGKDVQIYAVGGTEEIVDAFRDGEISILLRCDAKELAEQVISAVSSGEEIPMEQEHLLPADVMLGVW